MAYDELPLGDVKLQGAEGPRARANRGVGRRAGLWGLVSTLVFAAGCGSLPGRSAEVARHAETFEVLALEPYGPAPEGATTFYGHVVLGRAKVTDPAAQQRILDIIESGMGKWATEAKCFNPRHGIRATKGQDTVEIAICYECSNLEIRVGEESKHATTGNVRDELDKEFAAVGVTVAR